jgi:two-component system cell cycle response regulator
VPGKSREFRSLAVLFAQYGVEAFLESTHAFVAVLDREEKVLSCNPSFERLRQNMPDCDDIRDCLSAPSKVLFDEFFKTTLTERSRKQANLEFSTENRWGDYSSIFIPLPEEQVLFIAEPAHELNDLEMITAELERIKHALLIKETELKAVLVQADEVSHTDALTLLPNRKRIIADLQHEVIFSDRYGTPLAISLWDIDHFKDINDKYGHVVGDDVLRTLAMELRDHIRHPDTIGRYGGEEFLVVLPHSTVKAAVEQAERLCKHVQSLVIQSGEHKISLTISVGVAQYRINKEGWQGFLNRADTALYQAKNNGRNQWVVAGEHG